MEHPSLGTPPSGSIRFNTDSSKLEIYNGEAWWEIDATSPELQTGGTRGVFGAGESPKTDTMDYVNLSTTGNAIDFGNLIANNSNPGALGSRVRGFWVGGETPTIVNTIQFIDFDRTSNATDYSDLAQAARRVSNSALSNSTRGIVGGGYDGSNFLNVIQYFTVSSNANAVDFGDLNTTYYYAQGVSSPTRGIWMNGEEGTPSASFTNSINYVTISTTGNSSEFGDSTVSSSTRGAASNSIRAVGMGGKTPSSINTIDYITIATIGNAIDFGDLPSARANGTCCASSTKIVYGGGSSNTIEYVQIMTTGNAIDFGDLTVSRSYLAACSNGHGGLG